MKRLFLSLFLILGTFSESFAASNATDVYLLAQTKSTSELGKVEDIDAVDSDGNTALCSAIKDNNIDAYNLLKKAGANTEHKCVKKIPAKQYQAFTQKLATASKPWSFLGMGKWAWTAIGVGVAGGAAAAGMGGGGASGGDGSGDNPLSHYTPHFNEWLQQGFQYEPCQDGYYATDSAWDWAGVPGDSEKVWMYKCAPNYCSYTTTECTAGYVETGNTCKSGETLYKECIPNSCDGYDYMSFSSCPEGWTMGSSCLSGTTMKYKCDSPQPCLGYEYTDSSQCPEGWTPGSSCLSGATTKYKCDTAATCLGYEYTDSSQCPAGYTIGSSCLSGTTTMYKCDNQQPCTGYEYTDSSQCPEGWTTGSSCLSGATTKYKCDTPATCPNQSTECPTGFHETGETCQSGNNTFKQCEADTCDGYEYTSSSECPVGYTTGSSCLAGNTMKYKCDTDAYCSYHTLSCTGGYEETGQTCQSGETVYVKCKKISCTEPNMTWTASGCVCQQGYENYVQGEGCSLIPINCGNNAHQSGTNCECDDGYYNYQSGIGCEVYYPSHSYLVPYFTDEYNIQNDDNGDISVTLTGIASNASNNNSSEIVTKALNIVNNGDGDIAFNMNYLANATLNSTSVLGFSNTTTGNLNLYNTGNGDIYGPTFRNSWLSLNINSGVSNPTEQTNGNVSIQNTGDGNIYGMYGNNSINANITGTVDSSHSVNATANGTILLENHGNGTVYGMYDTDKTTKEQSQIYNAYSNATISIGQKANVSGQITISNEGEGDVYGMYSHNALYGAHIGVLYQKLSATSGIQITNIGPGNVYGMYSDSDVRPAGTYSSSNITITNTGDGNVYGLYSGNRAFTDGTNISIINSGTGTAYGAFGEQRVQDTSDNNRLSIHNLSNGVAFGAYAYEASNRHALNMYNVSDGDIIGVAGHNSALSYNEYNDFNHFYNMGNGWVIAAYGDYAGASGIIIDRDDNYPLTSYTPSSEVGGTAIGIYAGSELYANGPIIIKNASTAYGAFAEPYSTLYINAYTSDLYQNTIQIENSEFAVGVYVGENGTLTNNGDILIDNASTAYGIYAAANSHVVNSGDITITNSTNAYGIYAETGAVITNSGTISVNGSLCYNYLGCDGSSTDGHNIVLNGATLINSGIITAKILDLDSANGNFFAGNNSQFLVANALSGNLNISSELVQSGNQTTYIAENMIDAGDVSGLNVRSASAMFNASLADNGHDVVMQMKDFNELTDNASLAAFLTNNYANGKGQDLFSTLKSMDNMSAFNSTLSGLTGLNTFTQFAHEDLSAMREISFSMNNKLFENSNRDSFDISDSTGYFSFSNSHNGGNGQYGISSEKVSDNWKLGYGMAMANINTGNGDNMHRQNKMWLFYMPATYTNDNYELVIAPKAGFANSEYNRRGYNNINYEGYIEKRIFGLMNDLRYPLTFGNWTIAPDLAFNTIVYEQSGHEDEQEFSLVIPDDRTVSVETGFGFYTKYEKAFNDGSKLKLNSGLMAYREFGDTYDIKLGIRGMDGTFCLYNNDYKYRAAASLGFDYMAGRLHMYGNTQYFMDNANYMNFKGGISYRF